jgi:hypothetical protein
MMAELTRWLSRLPIIRYGRWLYYAIQVARHYALWQSLGYLPVNRAHDDAVLDQIWRGER